MREPMSRHSHSLLILISAMLLCGLISLGLGKELCWDLANYHYYNPFAFLHHRTTQDYWPPSNIHVHLIPTLDFLSYFLINHFHTLAILFILGALHGINVWLVWQIALFFLKYSPSPGCDLSLMSQDSSLGDRPVAPTTQPRDDDRKIATSKRSHAPSPYNTGIALLFAFMGLYGPSVWSGIGSFQNDHLVSVFVLGFFLLQCYLWENVINNAVLSKKLICCSGLLLGIAAGLKLTAASFIVGTFLTGLVMPINLKTKLSFLFFSGIAIAAGMCLSAGYWLLLSWQQYHNPFFPFLNGIFHSTQFVKTNFWFPQFFPHTWFEAVFFPFYFSFSNLGGVGFHDFRYPFLFILFCLAACFGLRGSQKFDLTRFWLYGFFIFSYIAWECTFSVARYLIPLEWLSPLIIYLLVKQLVKTVRATWVIVTFLFLILIFTMEPITLFRAPWYEKSFLNVKLPAFIKQTPRAMTLIAYPAYATTLAPRPLSYLIPFFPSQWQFVGIPFRDKTFIPPDANSTQKIQRLIYTFQGNFFLLTLEKNMPAFYATAREMGLVPQGPCDYIYDDRQRLTQENILICPVKKALSMVK